MTEMSLLVELTLQAFRSLQVCEVFILLKRLEEVSPSSCQCINLQTVQTLKSVTQTRKDTHSPVWIFVLSNTTLNRQFTVNVLIAFTSIMTQTFLQACPGQSVGQTGHVCPSSEHLDGPPVPTRPCEPETTLSTNIPTAALITLRCLCKSLCGGQELHQL